MRRNPVEDRLGITTLQVNAVDSHRKLPAWPGFYLVLASWCTTRGFTTGWRGSISVVSLGDRLFPLPDKKARTMDPHSTQYGDTPCAPPTAFRLPSPSAPSTSLTRRSPISGARRRKLPLTLGADRLRFGIVSVGVTGKPSAPLMVELFAVPGLSRDPRAWSTARSRLSPGRELPTPVRLRGPDEIPTRCVRTRPYFGPDPRSGIRTRFLTATTSRHARHVPVAPVPTEASGRNAGGPSLSGVTRASPRILGKHLSTHPALRTGGMAGGRSRPLSPMVSRVYRCRRPGRRTSAGLYVRDEGHPRPAPRIVPPSMSRAVKKM